MQKHILKMNPTLTQKSSQEVMSDYSRYYNHISSVFKLYRKTIICNLLSVPISASNFHLTYHSTDATFNDLFEIEIFLHQILGQKLNTTFPCFCVLSWRVHFEYSIVSAIHKKGCHISNHRHMNQSRLKFNGIIYFPTSTFI